MFQFRCSIIQNPVVLMPASATTHAKMSKFRLKVDLSNFYDDRRKYAYISVNPEWTLVKCLQEHVRNLFNLPNIEFVTEDSCYFPPLEDISVIKKGDVLKVVECTDKNKSNGYSIPEDVSPKKKKKSKSNEGKKVCNPEEDYSPARKKSKKHNCDLPEVPSKTGVDDAVGDVRMSVKKLKKLFDSKCEEACFPSKSDLVESEELQCERKTKRKRRRKKKTKKDLDSTITEYPRENFTTDQETPKTTLVRTKSAGHIRFDDSGKAIACESEAGKGREKRPVIFKNHLDDLNASKPRIIIASVFSNCATQKSGDIIPENIPVVNGKESNLESLEVLPIIDVETSDIHHVGEQRKFNGYEKDSNPQQVVPKVFKCEDILKLAEPLEGDPKEGDVVLFKIYRLNENCEPSLSEYICGKFEGMEESTNFLKIFLIDGQDQILDPKGELTVGEQGESSSYLYLKSEDLVDKKVFKM